MKQKSIEEVHNFEWRGFPAGVVKLICEIASRGKLRRFVGCCPQKQTCKTEQNEQNK
jgi:hypothetical protein